MIAPGLVQLTCSIAELMTAPAGTCPAQAPMIVGNRSSPWECGVWPSTLIETPVPLGIVGVSAVICASSTCAAPLNQTVCGVPPINNAALAKPAWAEMSAVKVTLVLFDVV